MYLYDYQLTQLKKVRRGGNYILHGPRAIGMTTILLNSALMIANYHDNSEVLFFTKNSTMVARLREDVFNIIYASKVSNVSPFQGKFDIREEHDNLFRFNNDSTLKISGPSPLELRAHDPYQMVVFDCANSIEFEVMDELYQLAKPCNQLLIGVTGKMPKESFVYQLWISSVKGKNNFDYVRIPFEVSPNKHFYKDMKQKISHAQWLSDVEMMESV